MALGQRLKELRTKAGLSQAELAKRVAIDVTYLSKLENDRQRASERVVRLLADVLEIDPGRLLLEAGHVPTEFQVSFETTMLGNGPDAGDGPAPPRYRTRFIDREADRKRLVSLLEAGRSRPEGSLISLTGPPGSGKTRLVAEVANQGAPDRPIIWVRAGDDAERIVAAFAVRLPEPGALVVLDDADRALDACTAAARRLIAAGATVVATSRQPLGVYGHQHLRLAPLPVPDRHQRPVIGDGPGPDLGRLWEQESVELFVDRAALAQPDFQLGPATALAVFDVCRWLDGLPLAIELAALRLGQMTVADLAARVGRDLVGWLSGNTPDVPDRHGSLKAAIGWSYDRLDDRQRAVARRLGVFEYTFSVDDAVKVASDEELSAEFVEATVMQLVDRSLLYWREDADRRAVYRWLRPIKQYARQQLDRAPDRDVTIERYRAWVRDEVDALQIDLPRRESEWERLADLTPELVSTVYDLPAAEQADAMKRMADALSKTVQFGNLAEHVTWLSRQFSGTGPEVFREAGMVARVQGELSEARSHFEAAYRVAVTNRDDEGQANASLDLAENAADLGEHEEAEKLAVRAAALYDKLEDERGRIEILNLRGKIRQERGELLAAEELLLEALRTATRIEDTRLIAYCEHSLGVGDYLMRRIPSARARLEVSLDLRRRMRNVRGVARVIEAFTLIESELGNHELALQLLGAARRYRRSSGVLGIPPWWTERLDQVEQEARIHMAESPEAADEALALGAALTLAEAADLVLQLAPALPVEALGNPLPIAPLRRPVPAGAVVATDLDRGSSPLERELVESRGSVTDAARRLHRARLLMVGEPIESRTSDILCLAMDPHHHRGVIVPVFASGRALAEAVEQRKWNGRPFLEVRFEQLRASLGKWETAVINPWTVSELWVTATDLRYPPSIAAPASTRRADKVS